MSSLIPRRRSFPVSTQIGAVQQTADSEVYRLGVNELAQPFVLLLHRVQRSVYSTESRPESNAHFAWECCCLQECDKLRLSCWCSCHLASCSTNTLARSITSPALAGWWKGPPESCRRAGLRLWASFPSICTSFWAICSSIPRRGFSGQSTAS